MGAIGQERMRAGRILKRFAADLVNVRRILVDPVSHSSPNKQGAHDFTKIDAAIIHANDCTYLKGFTKDFTKGFTNLKRLYKKCRYISHSFY